MSSPLTLAVLIYSPALTQSLKEALAGDRYSVRDFSRDADFLNFIEQQKDEVDCLIFQAHDQILTTVNTLYQRCTVLPVVFLHSLATDNISCTDGEQPRAVVGDEWPDFLYHASEVFVSDINLVNIGEDIDQAISKFLNLTPLLPPSKSRDLVTAPEQQPAVFLLQQQRRLSEKLKERLGYLAVYYNRNPHNFFRNLPHQQRQDLRVVLKEQYRQIALTYFTSESKLNDLLDQFVALVFFADLSVSEVVEIHMDLMEDFANQLKIEGWNEDILLDYRLTLIDVIAHICEMYRRSIPSEERK